MSIRNSQASLAPKPNAASPAASRTAPAPATAARGPNHTRRSETVDLSWEAREPEQATRVGDLMAVLEDMLGGSTERTARATEDQEAAKSPEQQIKNLQLQLEADGRPGLEAALRKAGYSAEGSRNGRVLNQILQNNGIASMNSLRAGARLSVPSSTQGAGSGGSLAWGGGTPAWNSGGGSYAPNPDSGATNLTLGGVEVGANARRLVSLARNEIATNPGNGRQCFNRVANSLDKMGIVLKGGSAAMAAAQLARHPKVKEAKVPASQLTKLPAGAIVVWAGNLANGGRHNHGHISIADGTGSELADVKRPQITNYGSQHRVFIPVG